MSKTTLFFKEVVARLKGDDQTATGIKIERKVLSSLKSQIANLKAKLIHDQIRVENAQEDLDEAFFTTEVFTDNSSYIYGIKKAQEALDAANVELETTKDTIDYFEGKMSQYFTA